MRLARFRALWQQRLHRPYLRLLEVGPAMGRALRGCPRLTREPLVVFCSWPSPVSERQGFTTAYCASRSDLIIRPRGLPPRMPFMRERPQLPIERNFYLPCGAWHMSLFAKLLRRVGQCESFSCCALDAESAGK